MSIIMPAYNVEKYIEATVESVRAQSYTDWEIVIVDDGSRDGTAAVAERLAQRDSRIRFGSQPNGGVSAARNTGYAMSDPAAPYVVFFDADDLWHSHTLAALVGALESDPTFYGSYGLARYVDVEGRPIRIGELEAEQRERIVLRGGRRHLLGAGEPTPFEAIILSDRCRLCVGTVLVRRSAFGNGPPCIAGTRSCEDWLCWLFVSAHGPFAFIDDVIMDYRQHSSNVSGSRSAMDAGYRYAQRLLMHHPALTDGQRAMARTAYRHHNSRKIGYAIEAVRRGHPVDAARQIARAARGYSRYWRDLLAGPPGPPTGRTEPTPPNS